MYKWLKYNAIPILNNFEYNLKRLFMLRNYIKSNIRHLKKGNILGILVANAQVCKIENIKTSLRQRLLKPET